MTRRTLDGLFDHTGAATPEQVNATIRKHFAAGALDFVLRGEARRRFAAR